MNQPSKEEIYAKRLNQSKINREDIVNKALEGNKEHEQINDTDDKRHVHFKFSKKSGLFD